MQFGQRSHPGKQTIPLRTGTSTTQTPWQSWASGLLRRGTSGARVTNINLVPLGLLYGRRWCAGGLPKPPAAGSIPAPPTILSERRSPREIRPHLRPARRGALRRHHAGAGVRPPGRAAGRRADDLTRAEAIKKERPRKLRTSESAYRRSDENTIIVSFSPLYVKRKSKRRCTRIFCVCFGIPEEVMRHRKPGTKLLGRHSRADPLCLGPSVRREASLCGDQLPDRRPRILLRVK